MRKLVLLALLGAALALAGCSRRSQPASVSTHTPHASAGTQSTSTPAGPSLRDIGLRQARGEGDPRPASIACYQGNPGYGAVYTIVLHGHFADRMAYMPSGASIPTGTVLVLTVATSNGVMAGLSLGNTQPNLEHLTPMACG